MTDGEMKKVSAWIPQDTLTKLEEKGYQNRAEAIRLGLDCLLKESTWNPLESIQEDKRNPLESIRNPLDSTQDDKSNRLEYIGIQHDILTAKNEEHQRDIAGYKENIKALNVEIARLKEVLQNAPDPVELVEARTRIEGLQMVLDERNKRIMELTQYKEDIGAFANYFKSNPVKQIEAPVAEKKRPWYRFW